MPHGLSLPKILFALFALFIALPPVLFVERSTRFLNVELDFEWPFWKLIPATQMLRIRTWILRSKLAALQWVEARMEAARPIV